MAPEVLVLVTAEASCIPAQPVVWLLEPLSPLPPLF